MRNSFVFMIFGLVCFLSVKTANAQQQAENSMSQYFRNRILWNAGFTGMDGNKVYIMQNRSWIGFDGAPVLTNLSGEFNFGKNSSLGLQFSSDVAGVLYRTNGTLNYSYRVKLGEQKELRIGIALAFFRDRINSKYLEQGGAADPVLLNSINNKIQYDGNFGMVYTNEKLSLGLSLLRLRETLKSNNLFLGNLAVAQFGGSYNILFNNDEDLSLKPIVMLKFYNSTPSVLDIGAQFEYNKQLNAMLVYQSIGNIRAGAGIKINNIGEANFFYNTNTKTANVASQQYEIGFGLNLKSKRETPETE